MKSSMKMCGCGAFHPADAVVAQGRFQGTTGYATEGAPVRATRREAMQDVCPQWMPAWQCALSAYDAHLADDGRIVRRGKTLGVTITEKKDRLRIESVAATEGRVSEVAGTLLASGPITAETVERFVESFWYWSKQ